MGWVVEKAKQGYTNTLSLERLCCPHVPTEGHYSTTRPRQMCSDSVSNIRSPLLNWSPQLVPFHQSWIYMVGRKHSGKADQLTLNSGGSEQV